jgi:hypothetical protein
MTATMRGENAVRKAPQRAGYRVVKFRGPESLDNHGGFMIVDADTHLSVAGNDVLAAMEKVSVGRLFDTEQGDQQ